MDNKQRRTTGQPLLPWKTIICRKTGRYKNKLMDVTVYYGNHIEPPQEDGKYLHYSPEIYKKILYDFLESKEGKKYRYPTEEEMEEAERQVLLKEDAIYSGNELNEPVQEQLQPTTPKENVVVKKEEPVQQVVQKKEKPEPKIETVQPTPTYVQQSEKPVVETNTRKPDMIGGQTTSIYVQPEVTKTPEPQEKPKKTFGFGKKVEPAKVVEPVIVQEPTVEPVKKEEQDIQFDDDIFGKERELLSLKKKVVTLTVLVVVQFVATVALAALLIMGI